MIAPAHTDIPAQSSLEFPALNPVVLAAQPSGVEKPGYYGIPSLKAPKWKWEIALYFFFEGISAGSFVLGTMAHLFARGRYPALVRNSRYLALATLAPCPPLLIADLGRPERFLHMLRVVKRTSPMNTGAWALTFYGQFAAALAIVGRASARSGLQSRSALILSITGLPFALTMIAYPGVLLSTTSNPVWAHTRFLGALIRASSMSAAAAALSLVAPSEPLARIEDAASACEAVAAGAYLATAGRAAQPLTSGAQAPLFWGALAVGIVAPAILRRRRTRTSGILASALSLGGALMLKWVIVYAGRTSAKDPEAVRFVTQPSESAPGWTPAAIEGISHG